MTTIIQMNAEDLRAELKKFFQEYIVEIQTTSTIPNLPDRIDLTEACQITGLRKATLYRLSMDKKLPVMKFGKRLVFSRKELIAWVENRTKGSQEAPDTLRKAALIKLR